jgi:hypothetical protein
MRPAAHLPHAGIQRLFPGMPKRRVAEIMGEGGRFRKLRDQAVIEQRLFDKQIVRDCAGNLGDLDAVRQSRAIKICLPDAEDLRLPLQPSERRAVQDSVPVSFGRMTMVLAGRLALRVSTLQKKFIHKILDPLLHGAERRRRCFWSKAANLAHDATPGTRADG